MRLFRSNYLSLCVVLAFLPWGVRADTPCTPINKDIPVRQATASAGFFANLRNSDDSINYLTDELLSQAEANAGDLQRREEGCSRVCSNAAIAVVFRSVPRLTLSGYSESARCDQLLSQTTQNPIVFDKKLFDSKDEAEDWYEELTQGDGDDGEILYAKCPGKCSPSYTSVIYKQASKFVVTTSVVCGHARDKDDDQYNLSAALRWVCPQEYGK